VHLSFLTPEAGVLALGAILPVVLMLDGEHRSRIVRAALRLPDPMRSGRALLIGCLAAVPLLLGIAAMQPIVDIEARHITRTDAECWFVIDTSRSMVASRTPTSPTRFERAANAALRLRSSVGTVPSGIASLTDRLLPHLFPTPDKAVFSATVKRSMGVDRPPPGTYNVTATTLGSLAGLAAQNYYTRPAKRRVAVVFTDAESRSFPTGGVGALFRRRPGIKTIFVRIGNEDERVYTTEGAEEPGYQPVPGAGRMIRLLAAATGGEGFDEHQLKQAGKALRKAVGSGRTKVEGREKSRIALAPWAVALTFLPLGLVLWRRNL
jgi:hypothetical protein